MYNILTVLHGLITKNQLLFMKEHKFIKFIIEPSKNRMIIHKNQSFAISLPRYLATLHLT